MRPPDPSANLDQPPVIQMMLTQRLRWKLFPVDCLTFTTTQYTYIFVGCRVVIQYINMSNGEIRVISISTFLHIYHFFVLGSSELLFSGSL
jgi:hypothetical protein